MSIHNKTRDIIIEIVCLAHVILFVYAALNKILEFQTFQVQLGQSPLLSAFAGPISYLVPTIEILISIFLLVSKLRYCGLYAALSLMVMFSAYIFIMLNFSPFTPCSCGGILEDMDWSQHLIFNIIFTVLGIIGLLLYKRETALKIRVATIVAAAILNICVVTVLFLLSEDTMHNRNNFTRRFPKHPTTAKETIELPYPSYYIAGYDAKHIYLGNRSAPLLITVYDLNLNKKKEVRIELPRFDFKYKAPRMVVKPPYFYFTDGTVPCVFVGDTVAWKAKLKMFKNAYFLSFVPLDNQTAIVRSISSKTKQNTLGLLSFGSEKNLILNSSLLKKQVDGLFDTSGQLLVNSQTNSMIYTYFFRNQFLITDLDFKNTRYGKTIDTISRAQVKAAKIKSKGMTTLAEQPLLVNRHVATYGNYLFVNSALIGKFESRKIWEKASIIDVYNLSNHTYAFSFYIYNKSDRKMDDFIIIDDYAVSLNGKFLTIERLKTDYYELWNKKGD